MTEDLRSKLAAAEKRIQELEQDPPDCDPQIYEKGQAILMMAGLSSRENQTICAAARAWLPAGTLMDWHFIGGRAVFLVIGDRIAAIHALKCVMPQVLWRCQENAEAEATVCTLEQIKDLEKLSARVGELETALSALIACFVTCSDPGHRPSQIYSNLQTNQILDLARTALAPAKPAPMPQAATDVLAERRRQVEGEGFAVERDDQYTKGELALAAASYSAQVGLVAKICAACGEGLSPEQYARAPAPVYWPWSAAWWKPVSQRRDLVRAAALILAEIERLDRASAGTES